MVGIGNALYVVGKILWRQSMQALVNEHSQLEVDAFLKTAAREGLTALVWHAHTEKVDISVW